MAKKTFNPIDYAKAYQHGLTAASLSRDEESMMYIPGALVNLYQELDQYVTGPAEIYKKVQDASNEAKQALIKIATSDYNTEKKKIKLEDLYNWFSESISNEAPEELRGKFKSSFGAYLGRTIEEIETEIEDAKYTLNPRTNASDKDKESAKKAIRERQEILGKMNFLENYSLERARQEAVNASVKPNLEELVK